MPHVPSFKNSTLSIVINKDIPYRNNTYAYSFKMSSSDRPAPLRLGTVAPNFKAETTAGPIDFHEFIGDRLVVSVESRACNRLMES